MEMYQGGAHRDRPVVRADRRRSSPLHGADGDFARYAARRSKTRNPYLFYASAHHYFVALPISARRVTAESSDSLSPIRGRAILPRCGNNDIAQRVVQQLLARRLEIVEMYANERTIIAASSSWARLRDYSDRIVCTKVP